MFFGVTTNFQASFAIKHVHNAASSKSCCLGAVLVGHPQYTLRRPGMAASQLSAVRDITKYVRINRVSDHQYQEAGFGGSADIFWYGLPGIYKTTTSDDFRHLAGPIIRKRGV